MSRTLLDCQQRHQCCQCSTVLIGELRRMTLLILCKYSPLFEWCCDLSCSRSQHIIHIPDIIQFRLHHARYAGWGESSALNKILWRFHWSQHGEGRGKYQLIRTAHKFARQYRWGVLCNVMGRRGRPVNAVRTQQKYYCVLVKLRIYNLHTPSCQTPLSHNSMVSCHWRTSPLPFSSLFTRLQMGGYPSSTLHRLCVRANIKIPSNSAQFVKFTWQKRNDHTTPNESNRI